MYIRPLADVYPQDPPDKALFDACAYECKAAALSIEQTVRTLAFVIGAILTSNDLPEAEQQRLLALLVQDVGMILVPL